MRQFSWLFLAVVFCSMLLADAQSQPSAPVDVTIDRNGVLLKSKFYIAKGTGSFPTVILLHGFPGNEADVLGIGNKLSRAGINALTFNYGGTYQSQGKHSFENTQRDIRAAFEFIHKPENILNDLLNKFLFRSEAPDSASRSHLMNP